MLSRFRLILAMGVGAGLLGLAALAGPSVPRLPRRTAGGPNGLRVTLRLTPEAASRIAALGLEVPVTGRMFVLVARENEREPRLQVDVQGIPLWGADVSGVAAGETRTIAAGDTGVVGYPFARFADLPPGDYWVQGFLSVYTTYRRADGHTLRMHADAGDGQNLWISPGNAYSRPARIHLDPKIGGEVRLDLTEVLPPLQPLARGGVLQQGNPPDRPQVRFVKIRSALLSAFWGRDMYIGANVLLPRGYDERGSVRYPVVYYAGHFPGDRAPFGFAPGQAQQGRGAGFAEWWMSDAAPRVIAVSIRDANPYYDTSYWLNSPNVGPYGDAITNELIPYLERTFRIIPEPWARVVAGGSTGGWEALAVQVFNPDFFGGTWGWCPDPVDFHYHQLVDLYRDENAYSRASGWLRLERPGGRLPDGNVTETIRQENDFERAVGPDARSGGQWAIWEAAYGPVAANGYPARVWDPVTGAIDRGVASWWREHTDLNAYLARNWATLGPKLRGKLHVTVGEDDTWYLDDAVHLLDDSLRARTNPPADASFEYGPGKPHCWIGASPTRPGQALSNAEVVTVLADYMARHAPPAADVRSWHP
ncbi:MAG TPA: alpha/beta hydrolase-fold protein [Longimicrobiales bacterium]|nr:alpha/beta hydrolase-fold protein [Longimicrobiales bacterium]